MTFRLAFDVQQILLKILEVRPCSNFQLYAQLLVEAIAKKYVFSAEI